MQQNYINHVVLVLDHSTSMGRHRENLIRVADAQIKHLAQRSQELDQETRVSIYSFGSTVECLVYDKDVLRLPSIRDLYHVRGRTALCTATITALDELAQTATLHGDHSFLVYVLTDGQENQSAYEDRILLPRKLTDLPDSWTVACFVPSPVDVADAKKFGFPAGNIAVWDPNDSGGVEEGFSRMRQATDNYMQARSRGGFTGTRNLFSTGVDAVNDTTVKQALDPLRPSQYMIFPVHSNPSVVDGRWAISDFVPSRTGLPYVPGKGYYQLTKREKIQPQKEILIREKGTNNVFGGQNARTLLGLGYDHVQVKPDFNPKYDVFVQSTSSNRKLMPGTELLVVK